MVILLVSHAYSLVVCLYREVFDVKVGLLAGVMKMLDVIGMFLYFAVFIECLSYYSFWSYDITDYTIKKFINIKYPDALEAMSLMKPDYFKGKV